MSMRCWLGRHEWHPAKEAKLGELVAAERLGVRIPKRAIEYTEVCRRCHAVRDTKA